MIHHRTAVAAVSALLLALLPLASAEATTKAGQPCRKVGAKVMVGGKAYRCTRVGQQSVWRAVRSATPAAQPSRLPGGFTVVSTTKRVAFPSWSGQDVNGKSWSTAGLAGGVTVVNLWASWCGPCREEWPELQAAAAAHPAVRFVGINSLDSAQAAREFLQVHASAYEQVVDDRAVIASSLTTVPSAIMPITMILDARGRIAAWVPGATTRAAIDQALAAV